MLLSVFPGVDLLGRAFEGEGFCVVRGPDPIFGGDVREFHPPAGVFDGVIGGPPCQADSQMRTMNPHAGRKHGSMVPDFERVVEEAAPRWFLMENVPGAPIPQVAGYWPAYAATINNRWIGKDFGQEQSRLRRFCFATRFDVTPRGVVLDLSPDIAVFENPCFAWAVLAGHGGTKNQRMRRKSRGSYDLAEMCELQGLPATFADELPFTVHGKRKVIGNGVPIPMGRAIARAVKRALEPA